MRLTPLDRGRSPIIIATASRNYCDSPNDSRLIWPLLLPITGDKEGTALFDEWESRGNPLALLA